MKQEKIIFNFCVASLSQYLEIVGVQILIAGSVVKNEFLHIKYNLNSFKTNPYLSKIGSL